ncbi:MAG TPA: hypothetical protein VGJ84_11805 [Polyangiaceae bacterium]|jgi:hypothetical protein
MRPFDPSKPDLCCEISIPRIPQPLEQHSEDWQEIAEARTAEYDVWNVQQIAWTASVLETVAATEESEAYGG